MRYKLMLTAFILFAVAALQCSPKGLADEDKAIDGDEREVARYNEHRELWERTGSDNYTFVYDYKCFCTNNAGGPIKVSVRNDDVITSIEYVSSGEPLERVGWFKTAEFFTIDGLFDGLRDAIAHADEYSVRYHREFGYPINVTVDTSFNFIDEEYRFTAYDYMPQ